MRTLQGHWRRRDARRAALELWAREKRPDPDAPEIASLQDFSPSFLPQVEEIVVAMAEAGSRVFVATLPGIYVSGERPTPETMAKGHLPGYTDNPYVLAAITDAYNARLRSLAAERGAGLIELADWARASLRPRHEYFTDSVHLTPRGQQMIGDHLAGELVGQIPSHPD